MVLSFISKGLGFIRDIAITKYLGFSSKTDALFIAISVVTLLFSTFNTTIRTTFAPLFSSRYNSQKQYVLEEFNTIKNNMLMILCILTITIFFFSDIFLKILTPGLTGETESYASNFLKYLSIVLIFYGLYFTSTGFLQAIKVFKTSEAAAILNNITIISCIILFYKEIDVYSVIIGYIMGSLFQAIYSLVILRFKTNYKEPFSFKINLKHNKFVEYIRLSKYVLLGSLVTQITAFSDKFVASFLQTGSITALHYANLIKNLPLNMVILVVTNILFTNLSIYYQKSRNKFNTSIVLQLRYLLFFVGPIIVVLVTYSYEIIKILFYRGEFTTQGVTMTSQALVAYSIGLFFWVFKEIFTKASYAARETKVPLIITCTSLIINIIFNFIFSYFWGHIGIAAATSLSLLINSFLILVMLQKKNILVDLKSIQNTLLKFITILILSVIFIFWLKRIILNQLNSFISLVLGIIIVTFIYVLFSKQLGIDIKKLVQFRSKKAND